MTNIFTGVYRITCTANGRSYIGSSVNLANRFRQHKYDLKQKQHHSRQMQHCANKYGLSSFKKEVLLLCSEENLLMYEQILLDAFKPAFNAVKTAGRTTGYKATPEQRQLNSERGKKLRSTPEWRAAQSERIKKAHREGKFKQSQMKALHTIRTNPKYKNMYSENAKKAGRKHIFFGESLTLLEAEAKFNIAKPVIRGRMSTGWSNEEAVTVPVNHSTRRKRHRYKGKPVSSLDIAQMSGLPVGSICRKLKKGILPEEIINGKR